MPKKRICYCIVNLAKIVVELFIKSTLSLLPKKAFNRVSSVSTD